MFCFFFAQFCLVELWNDYKSLTCTKMILHIYCRKKNHNQNKNLQGPVNLMVKLLMYALSRWSWRYSSRNSKYLSNCIGIRFLLLHFAKNLVEIIFALMISDNCMLLSHCVSPSMLGKAFIVASTIMAKYKSTRKQLCNVTKLSKKASEKNLKNHVVIADEGSPNKLRAGEMEDQASVVFNRIVTLCHSQYYQKVMELRNIFLISLISCLSQTWSFADITRH